MRWPERVRIREVGPRDGIQSERTRIPTARKARFIEALAETGLAYIEAVSFVSQAAVPQMADALEVWRAVERRPEVFYSALVPNLHGALTGIEAGVDGLQVFVAATDSYNLANARRPVAQSLRDVAAVVEAGRAAGMPVEGTLSCAFGCPYEGDVAPRRVLEIIGSLRAAGITGVSLGDTTGMATPRRVIDVVRAVRSEASDVELNMHFHDTRGTGLANVLAAMDEGVDYFDASVGGMGGSPFAIGSSGNVATEDLVHMLGDMGIRTGIDLGALLEAARMAQAMVGAELPGKVLRAGPRGATVDLPG